MTKNSEGSEDCTTSNRSHPAMVPEEILLRECSLRRLRRSGPGGQHRNKVETAVVITHVPSGIRGEASERRSQEENRRQALFRLRVNLALDCRSPATHEQTFQSELWKGRSQGGRISINPKHSDFPALLAEALDALSMADWEAKAVAEQLGCTSSQLIKLLQQESRAIGLVNDRRRAVGKPIYR